jgi:hypothetical protein
MSMTGSGGPTAGEDQLLRALAEAVRRAGSPVREIEVGIPLSIAIGRMRPAVACGGCSTPLEFQGIPARTNARLSEPFHLVLTESSAA